MLSPFRVFVFWRPHSSHCNANPRLIDSVYLFTVLGFTQIVSVFDVFDDEGEALASFR